MEGELETFIQEIGVFLRENGQLSEDVEAQLSTYYSIQALTAVFTDTSDGEREYALELKTVCQEIICSDYVTIKSKAAAVFTIVVKVGPHEANIPDRLRSSTKEIEEYHKRIQTELHKADTLLQEMEQKLRQIADGTSTLTEELKRQLMMMHIDFKSCLKKASDHLTEADQALASLKADVKSYLRERFGFALVATAARATVECADGHGFGAASNPAGPTVQFSLATGVSATDRILAEALTQLLHIYDNYNKYMNHCKKLESKLNSLKSNYRAMEIDRKALEEKAKLF